MKNEQRRQEKLIRAMKTVWPAGRDGGRAEDDFNSKTLLQLYKREIEAMKETCQLQRNENTELVRLHDVQVKLSQELDDIEWNVEEHQNFLEIEARGFDNAEEQAWKQLSESLIELEKLSSIHLRLTTKLVDLKVDKERGLRYPLINQLRLAYRPKGDLDVNEIQAAWSSAAQLLLVCGTLLHYQSQHWKVVPLSTGAKLIRKATGTSTRGKDFVVYNLGHPKANGPETLLAWNDLVHCVVQHALQVLAEPIRAGEAEFLNIDPPPFQATSTSIGGINLLELDANDDSSWSQAIHCISSNLLWISECASRFALSQVLRNGQA